MDKIIIFGGTFDPIHNGHIALANKLVEVFKTPVTFMPNNVPSYKAQPATTKQQRLAMLKLALLNNPQFIIDERELKEDNYTYSHRILTQLRNEIGNATPLYFVIGGDSLISLDTWDYWDLLLNLTNFIVVNRSGYNIINLKPGKLNNLFQQCKTDNFNDLTIPHGKFYVLDFTPPDISSTIIRKKVNSGEDINHMLPIAVANYIQKYQLYS
ncbi:MAG: nicotinate-nucleotide adenylyltransferase [Burkholderiales bacterium]|nr:nicotinate-nucleotide adenylyltransferase [Burkholderiales bacterium]